MLDYFINGKEWHRMGNSCTYAAPHGTFRCWGNDRWCNITIFSDAEWQSFCQAIGNPPWAKDSRFDTVRGRKESENELNQLIEAWTINHTPEEVMSLLQANGIAAGIVEDMQDLFRDPQLKVRGFLKKATHPVVGPVSHIIPSIEMSRTSHSLRLSGPCLGEHSLYICKELLRYARF